MAPNSPPGPFTKPVWNYNKPQNTNTTADKVLDDIRDLLADQLFGHIVTHAQTLIEHAEGEIPAVFNTKEGIANLTSFEKVKTGEVDLDDVLIQKAQFDVQAKSQIAQFRLAANFNHKAGALVQKLADPAYLNSVLKYTFDGVVDLAMMSSDPIRFTMLMDVCHYGSALIDGGILNLDHYANAHQLELIYAPVKCSAVIDAILAGHLPIKRALSFNVIDSMKLQCLEGNVLAGKTSRQQALLYVLNVRQIPMNSFMVGTPGPEIDESQLMKELVAKMKESNEFGEFDPSRPFWQE